ncbi:hypothetical protein ACFQFC_18720 [Amorphoplanes digitatis]|uniref:Uncharacterized protein n=1 Tax=Actinoplanes digitatis TaxID=1868 RepID=A0A7W7MTX8_9ACTN|nr:hypothetical protein [Actinoplanes digitatis]MBB4766250.1 hypothetical protein [Actinoplanes digitatis]GID95977.1 hypothetical protein Adi01nite_53890 [Actinoplanes digitatis]
MSDGVFVPSGATPWSAYNTPRIWAMVAGEDDPESWRQVAALAAMAGLLDDQRKRLESAKESLARAWPPERNKAAAAFVDMIDDLLLNMAENKRIADSNAGALSQVLEALRQAKTTIEPLYQSYLDKSDDWVPGWWDNAEDELDEKAREQMREAERVVAHPDNTIKPPDLYEFKPRAYVSDPVSDPRDRGSGPDGHSAAGGSAGVVDVPHDPPPPLPNSGLAGPNGAAPGPGLAEVVTSPGLAPSGTAPAPQPTPTPGPAPSGLVIGGGAPGAPGTVRSPLGRGGPRALPGSVIGMVAHGAAEALRANRRRRHGYRRALGRPVLVRTARRTVAAQPAARSCRDRRWQDPVTAAARTAERCPSIPTTHGQLRRGSLPSSSLRGRNPVMILGLASSVGMSEDAVRLPSSSGDPGIPRHARRVCAAGTC